METDKDGLIMDLLAAEITARSGKDPGEHYRELTAQFGTPWYTRLDAPATAEQKTRLRTLTPDAFGAQGLDAAAERGTGGQGGVDEGQDDGRDGKAGGLGEHAQGVCVADALGPFADGVVGGRGDKDGVGDEGPGRAGFGVLAADRAAGLVGDGGGVEEFERGRGGDDLDGPAPVLG